jgi:hypothetical protein
MKSRKTYAQMLMIIFFTVLLSAVWIEDSSAQLFSEKATIISYEKASLKCNSVNAPQLHSFNNQLPRRWQQYFADSIIKIREKNGRLNPNSQLEDVNKNIRDAVLVLNNRRISKIKKLKIDYQANVKKCLNRYSQIRYEAKRKQLEEEAGIAIAGIEEKIRITAISFQIKQDRLVKRAEFFASSKKSSYVKRRAQIIKSLNVLRQARKNYLTDQRKIIFDTENKLKEKMVAATKLKISESNGRNLQESEKVASQHYNPLFKNIKREDNKKAKESFVQIKKNLRILFRRGKGNPFIYGKALNGPPQVDWDQIKSQPILNNKKLPSLKGRQPVLVGKTLSGSGNVLMIGDSIQELMGGYVKNYLPRTIGVTRNAVGGYNSIQIGSLFKSSYNARQHSVVVFDAGTNDNPNYSSIVRDQLRSVAKRVGPNRCIVVSTVNTLYVGGVGPWKKNSAINEFAKNRPLTVVANWYEATRKNKSLLLSDGLHPSSTGNKVRAKMIAQAIMRCAG